QALIEQKLRPQTPQLTVEELAGLSQRQSVEQAKNQTTAYTLSFGASTPRYAEMQTVFHRAYTITSLVKIAAVTPSIAVSPLFPIRAAISWRGQQFSIRKSFNLKTIVGSHASVQSFHRLKNDSVEEIA